MLTPRFRRLLYGCLLVSGTACMALAAHQQQYANLVAVGNQAVAEKRFDSLDYVQASQRWLANTDRLLFNQGVQAYAAQNFPQAVEFFRRVSQQTTHPGLRMHSLYNLSLVLLTMQDVPGAVELLKAALRLDPRDTDAKFMLEQLYHLVRQQHGDEQAQQARGMQGEARGQEGAGPLQQAPGVGKEAGEEQATGNGQGRSTPRSGI